MQEMLILVDENDKQTGTMEKMETHRKGLLHRCFSIFIFNSKGEMLLQKRANGKYHSGGLWTNTCCSHPRHGEEVEQAVHRRLKEEMGFDTDMREAFTFIYRAELDHDLTEHEYDHVYTGEYDGPIPPNPEEADGYAWENVKTIKEDIAANPDKYTVWFKIAFKELLERKPKLLS